jgi:hypothetical protein
MDDKLTPASARDIETCLSLALTSGSSLARNQAAEVTAKVVAERLVAQLERWLRDHAQADPSGTPLTIVGRTLPSAAASRRTAAPADCDSGHGATRGVVLKFWNFDGAGQR